ncbi:N-acetylmuramoyl-L-alanine amidase [Lysinibacillus irui]|uniref:Autolysin n=1 Tax=Lysinibacillus irui TaxID=2998077 RepID=A0ABU5NHN4_9BACI|nr:N-acetylmuramoyl-L-alanine amidase [Lysinibacillus irui]MEA0552977.1 N-acetylmuramoyl-L-alanine amidase [Lysinibacillus irui]MEA0975557.1 N-acetylmuramoyl-L-alanine amidase [Lysinibacillus irui]MEA1041711.1 N-acetylmuramoyl-L-alanine amidase [Lysinibacillus irui]
MSYVIEQQLMSGLPNQALTAAKYVIAHESGNPKNCGPDALEREIAYMNKNKAKAFTSHWVGGGGRIVQIAPVNRVQYGCGPKGNPLSYAQVELARTSDKEQFKKDYAAYIWLLRKLAKDAGIPIVLDGSGNGIKSHRWITDNLKGTTHRDPYSYLASMGITETQFKLDIKNGIEKEEVNVAKPVETKVMLNDAKMIPAKIVDGRTYVQVREIADLLNLKLVYNAESKITKLYEVE